MIGKNQLRRGAFVGVGVVAALSGALGLDATAAAADSVAAQQQVSQNWSGYVVTSKAGERFQTVSGSWVQPSVNPSSSQASSAFWVGLGGSSDSSQALEQVGTGADVANGQATYYAWYELVPAAQQRLNLAIQPGDHVSAKVTVNGTDVTTSIADETSGQSATKTLQMSNPDTSSAEWIAEAPALESQAGAQILPLADFGTVTFTNAAATAAGHTGSISDPGWSVAQVDMSSDGAGQAVGGDGRFAQAAQASSTSASAAPVSSDGSSFTVSSSSDAGTTQPASGYGDLGSGYADPSGYGDPGGDVYVYPGWGD